MEFGNLVISIMARGWGNGGIGAQAHKIKRIIFIVQKMPMPIKGLILRRLFSNGWWGDVTGFGSRRWRKLCGQGVITRWPCYENWADSVVLNSRALILLPAMSKRIFQISDANNNNYNNMSGGGDNH